MASQHDSVPSVSSLCQGVKGNVGEDMDKYTERFADSQDTGRPAMDKEKVVKKRLESAQTMSETFYNLVTDFYEYAWGQSFHFTPLYDDKSFEENIAEYERTVGKMLGAKPGMRILDVGCGVGGPGREVARSSGASVVGLNYNSYQIDRATKHSRKNKLDHLCTYIKSDFCDMNEVADASFDCAFAFEATCHAKDLVTVYREILRVMKPGGLFMDLAWATTDDYDQQNSKHVKIMNDVMYGNSLPAMRSQAEMLAAMRQAGLEVVEFRDLSKEGDRPWYHTLHNNDCCSLKNFRMSATGRLTTYYVLKGLEAISMVPEGTTKVSAMLEVAAISLVEAGQLGIFTPMFRILARKPA